MQSPNKQRAILSKEQFEYFDREVKLAAENANKLVWEIDKVLLAAGTFVIAFSALTISPENADSIPNDLRAWIIGSWFAILVSFLFGLTQLAIDHGMFYSWVRGLMRILDGEVDWKSGIEDLHKNTKKTTIIPVVIQGIIMFVAVFINVLVLSIIFYI